MNPETAMNNFETGNQLLQEGKLEEAIAAFRHAIELNPDLSWCHHNLGEALAKLGQLEEAIAAFRRAIELNPDFSWSYHHLGDILDRQQQWEEAVVAFRRAIELNPEHFGSYCGLGQSLVKLGRLDEAIAAYRRASELEPAADWIQYRLGEVLQQRVQVDIEGAIGAYQKAVDLNPSSETFRQKLEKVLAEQNHVSEEEITETIEDCLELKETPIEQKNIEEAIAEWRSNVELNPQADNNSLLNSLEPISTFQIYPEQLAIRSGQLVEKGTRKQLVSPAGNHALVSFGPYINVPDGLYKIGVNFQFTEASLDKELENSAQVGFKLDVATEGLYVWGEINVDTRQDQLEFFIELVDAKSLEIRFMATGTAFAINWIKLNLLYPPIDQDLAADYFFDLGKHLQLKGKQEHAGRLHRKVAELNPEGYLDKAIAHWRQATETEANWITYFNLGMLLAQKQQVEEAFACYQKILEIQPKKIDIYSDLILRLAKQDITIFQKASQKQLNEGEIYETIWQSLNQLGILNKESFDLPTEISPEATHKYFSENSNYKIINWSSLTDSDLYFLEQEGLSIANLELIPKDDIELEEIYINSFESDDNPVRLSRKNKKFERLNKSLYDINKGRYFQHSIVETGYIYTICPTTGKILRSNQSFPLNSPLPWVTGSWHPIQIYRFVGSEVFYLVCAVMPIGDKSFIYFPRLELVITFVHRNSCYASETQIINMLKTSLVSYWKGVEAYVFSSSKKEVAVNLAWCYNIGHYVWNEMSGLQYLSSNGTLSKVSKFLVGYSEYINIGDTYPEIRPEQIIRWSEPQDSWNLFKTIIDQNYVTVWPTDLIIPEELGNRIYEGAVQRCSPNVLQEIEDAKQHSPLIWIAIRSHYRVWLSQVEGIANIINTLQEDYPNLAVVFDGWGRHERHYPRAESEVKRETTIVEEILALVHTDIKAYNLIGKMSYERVAWVQAIDFYISSFSSGLVFPMWVANKPGVTHGNGVYAQTLQAGEFSPLIRENLIESIFLPADYAEDKPFGHANYDISWQKVYDASINLLKKGKTIEQAIAEWRSNVELNPQADNNNNSLLNSLEPISNFQIYPEQLAIRSGQLVEKGTRKQLVSPAGNHALVSFGPYINVPDGLYKIGVNFQFTEASLDKELENSAQVGFKLDVATEGLYVWGEINVDTRQDQLEFFIELVDAKSLEIRFMATGTAFAINWIELNLLYPPIDQDLAADYFFDLGKHLQLKGKQEHAGRLHRKVAELNPEGYLDKAIAHWGQATETEANWITYFNLGTLLAQKQQVEEAFACYRKILGLTPLNDCAISLDFTLILVQQGWFDLVITTYREVGKSDRSYLQLGTFLCEKGWKDEAVLSWKHLPKAQQFAPTKEDRQFDINTILVNKEDPTSLDGSYKFLVLDCLTPEDLDFMEKNGLSLDILHMIAQNTIWPEQIYLHAFGYSHINLNKQVNLAVPHEQNIAETGYIYILCPFSGQILRSNQSWWRTGYHDQFIYRFVGQEIFYLITNSHAGEKLGIYWPKQELIIMFNSHTCGIYSLNIERINTLKAAFVNSQNWAKPYLSSQQNQVAAVIGFERMLGHYMWQGVAGIHYLFKNNLLDKIDKFLIGPYDFFDITKIYPEIPEHKIIYLSGHQQGHYPLIQANNYFAFKLGGSYIEEELVQRINQASLQNCSQSFLDQVARARQHFPLLCIQLRGNRRFWASQVEAIASIINKLYEQYPNLGVIFDGYTARITQGAKIDEGLEIDQDVISQENQIKNAILANISPEIKTYSTIGATAYETIVFANSIDLHISPIGSGLTYLSWIANKPGVIHGPTDMYSYLALYVTSLVRENLLPQQVVPQECIIDGDSPAFLSRNYDLDWQTVYNLVIPILNQMQPETSTTYLKQGQQL